MSTQGGNVVVGVVGLVVGIGTGVVGVEVVGTVVDDITSVVVVCGGG